MKNKPNIFLLMLVYLLFPLGIIFKFIRMVIKLADDHPNLIKSIVAVSGLVSAQKIPANPNRFEEFSDSVAIKNGEKDQTTITIPSTNPPVGQQFSNQKLSAPKPNEKIKLYFAEGLNDNQKIALKKIVNFYKDKVKSSKNNIAHEGLQLVLSRKYRVGFCTLKKCDGSLARSVLAFTPKDNHLLLPLITFSDGRVNVKAYLKDPFVIEAIKYVLEHEYFHIGMYEKRGRNDACTIPQGMSTVEGISPLKEAIVKDRKELFEIYQLLEQNKPSVKLDKLVKKLKEIPSDSRYFLLTDVNFGTSGLESVKQRLAANPSLEVSAIGGKYRSRGFIHRLLERENNPMVIFSFGSSEEHKYNKLRQYVYSLLHSFEMEVVDAIHLQEFDGGDFYNNKRYCEEAAAVIISGYKKEVGEIFFPHFMEKFHEMKESYALDKVKPQYNDNNMFQSYDKNNHVPESKKQSDYRLQ